jgi:hypothetical protein
MALTLTLGTSLADTHRVIRLVGTGGTGGVCVTTHDRQAEPTEL